MRHVGGALAIDLRNDDDHKVDRLVQQAAEAPPGADVVFLVRPRQLTPYWSIVYLREHGAHLGPITVRCSDHATIEVWVAALRGRRE